ncbi:MAG: efflux RND transporter permease subunit [Halanaerobiales bacterium]|nr:efflux RND transporter permease subunit [Halanaerobiales bacterium]
MKLSDFSIKRPVTTVMLILLIVILGFISLDRLNIDLLPEINFPGAAVITSYENAGPQEVESLVTKPLENSLATVTNVKTINSTSGVGQSTIVMEFNYGTDMDFAALDMREQADLISEALPDDAQDPMIVQFDPSMIPVLQLGVYSGRNLADLKTHVEDNVIPRLERLQGVASVDLTGGLDREILIELNKNKMENYGVDFNSITQNLLLENFNLSGGKINRGNVEYIVRVTGKFESVDQIREVLIPTGSGRGFVKLSELGTVKDTYKEMNSVARVNGEDSIGLTIQKQTDANTVTVANRVRDEIKALKNEYPNLNMVPIADQAEYIEQSINSVYRNAILGGLLAILVLFLFLRNFRSTIIIGLAIPISIVTTFLLLYFGGLTINIISLGGLALGIGMLVDNSIVVLENIYRYKQYGLNRIEAASRGSEEVGMAIAASTFTTIVVFLPVIFVEGLTAQIFRELALTVSFSLFASLIVALTLIPMLSSKILKLSKKQMDLETETNMGFIKSNYRQSLSWFLSHRWIIGVLIVVLIAAGGFLGTQLGTEFLPQFDQGQFTVNYSLPVGTVLEETQDVGEKIEDEISEIPEVETIFTNIGVGNMMSGSSASESGSFTVMLKDLEQRDRSTSQVMEELRKKIKVPGADISIESQSGFFGPGGGQPINIKVVGENLEELERISGLVMNEMKQVEGVREVEDSFEEGRPEYSISIDRSLAARLGLRVRSVANTVKTVISGDVATRYEVGGDEYDVRVTMNESDKQNIEQLKNIMLPSPTGAKVPLSRVASFELTEGPKEILRINQERYSEITASLYQTDLGTAVSKIQERVDENVELPEGYSIRYGGQFQDLQQSFTDLFYAFLLAIVLVYMVMASQFESLVHPLVIMFTVPLAIVGVVFGLYVTGTTISVPALIGIITLAGIVVNNAIVLVDYINRMRDEGRTKHDAILEAGPIRLRPIMMTALTTILALIPLSLGIGEGSELQQPLAVVVISGLLFSTFLTLYVIPVIYSAFTDLSDKIKGVLRKVI